MPQNYDADARVSSYAQIHVSLVPLINGEQKTKPTQASIKDLRAVGLTADFVSASSTLYVRVWLNASWVDRLPLRRTARRCGDQQDWHVLSRREGTGVGSA